MSDVPRRLLFSGMWLVAAVLAVAVSWQGVAIVAGQVTERRSAPLSEVRVLAALRNASASPVVADPDTLPTVTAPDGPSPAVSAPPATRPHPAKTTTSSPRKAPADTTTTTSRPGPARPEPGAGGTTDTTVTVGTDPPHPPTATGPSPTTAPPAPPESHTATSTTSPAAEVETERTVRAHGGVIAVRYSENGPVELWWARPHDGFGTEIVRNEPNSIVVRFRSEHHESWIEVTWDGTRPVERVQENPAHS